MTTSGNATYDQSTGIVTLTQDAYSQKGAITLGTRIDSNKSFHFSGKVNLGNKYEGHGNGGDGIGFAFSPGVLGETGLNGAAVGIGGLSNALASNWIRITIHLNQIQLQRRMLTHLM